MQSAPSRSSCFSRCLFCFECLIHTRVLSLTSLVARYASFIFFFFSFSRFLFALIVGITLSLECALCFFRHRVHSSRLSVYVYVFFSYAMADCRFLSALQRMILKSFLLYFFFFVHCPFAVCTSCTGHHYYTIRALCSRSPLQQQR